MNIRVNCHNYATLWIGINWIFTILQNQDGVETYFLAYFCNNKIRKMSAKVQK